MNEIHKHTSQSVYLDVYGGSADALPVATYSDSTGATRALTVEQDTPPTGIDDRYHVVLTMADTQNEGEINIEWVFEINEVEVTKTDTFEVVTPYLTIAETKELLGITSDEDAIKAERAARLVINSHCGQSFGYAVDKTIVVEAHGEGALRLPARLIKLTGLSTLTAELDPLAAIIVSDGWYLKKGWSEEVTPIENDSAYWGNTDAGGFALVDSEGHVVFSEEKPGHGAVVYAPGTGRRATPWRNDYPFRITGDWGYKTVPGPVKEAARLLVADYACMEVAYRDKYLESITAADWRLQFNSQSWAWTGNVRADHLLSEFVLLDWALI